MSRAVGTVVGCALTVALLGVVGGPPTSGSAAVPPPNERKLAVEAQETPLTAFGGRVLWSSYDPVRKVFALRTFADGTVQTVPIAPRTVPFDADLGPDASLDGRTVAVYSRCRREPPYDFATRREQRLARVSSPRGSETLPSIFGSRIAFARTARRGSIARLKIRDPRRTRDAGRGSLGGSTVNPTGTDLSSTHLSFRWELNSAECGSSDLGALGEGAEVWLVDVRTIRRRRVANACSTNARGLAFVRGPVAIGPRVLIKEQGARGAGEAFVRVGPDGRRVRSDEAAARVKTFARDARASYVGIDEADSRFRILRRSG